MKKRKKGYYWVTVDAVGHPKRREVALWTGKGWDVIRSMFTFSEDNQSITEVNENRIIEDGTEQEMVPSKVLWYMDDVLEENSTGKEQVEANAKLCAAAPEMRQLLEEMLEDLKNAADWYGEGPYPIGVEYYENKIKELTT